LESLLALRRGDRGEVQKLSSPLPLIRPSRWRKTMEALQENRRVKNKSILIKARKVPEEDVAETPHEINGSVG
jgi:hypothetical protein